MDNRSQQQWQALLDSSTEGIWGVDLAGLCTFVNRTAARLLGFRREDLIGRNLHALVHHHYPDGREFPASECPVHNIFRERQVVEQDTATLFRKNGTPLRVEISAQPICLEGSVVGALASFRELTDATQQQLELHNAYQLAERRTAELDAVIESMPHGVFIATQDGKVRSNRRARSMTGEQFPAQLGTLRRALAGESSAETVRTAAGWIHSVAAPIFLNGQILGGVAVNTDVTQQRLQEEALRRTEKLAAVGQLAASIAHEINNPLESITNLLYLIRQSSSLAEVEEYAKIAQSELSRVTEITLQTLRFHRQQSRPTEVDVADLLRTVLALYTGRLLVRSIAADLRSLPTPRVCCLEGEIRQVINNLVRNAVEAMNTGGRLLIRIHPESGRDGGPGVRFTVADTGEGISPRILEHLFEPFQTTKEVTGTGLGLWVSKGIVDKHAGHIRVRSWRGERHGTVFSVWLPADGDQLLAACNEVAREAAPDEEAHPDRRAADSEAKLMDAEGMRAESMPFAPLPARLSARPPTPPSREL
jgi:PAS domain S-box-containing protein